MYVYKHGALGMDTNNPAGMHQYNSERRRVWLSWCFHPPTSLQIDHPSTSNPSTFPHHQLATLSLRLCTLADQTLWAYVYVRTCRLLPVFNADFEYFITKHVRTCTYNVRTHLRTYVYICLYRWCQQCVLGWHTKRVYSPSHNTTSWVSMLMAMRVLSSSSKPCEHYQVCPKQSVTYVRTSCTNEGQDDHLFIPAIDSKQIDARLPTITADLLLHTSQSSTSVPIHWNGPVAALATVGPGTKSNWLPYSRKIWGGIKFGGLADELAYRQIKFRQIGIVPTTKIVWARVQSVPVSTSRLSSLLWQAMALLKYFSPSLPKKVPSLTENELKEANAAVKQLQEGGDESGKRGKYNDYTAEERAQIGKYAAEHGPAKAVRHCSKLLGVYSSPVILRSHIGRQIKIRQFLKNSKNCKSAKYNSRQIFQLHGIIYIPV